ncbi:hypothetical protein RIF29_21926 [Crotalaria pallida]|uniref:Uncharacterized protein n=1 Tax=Crotalaria pallida TaxID=3830 RepID=A0AAN9FCD8_CROPI
MVERHHSRGWLFIMGTLTIDVACPQNGGIGFEALLGDNGGTIVIFDASKFMAESLAMANEMGPENENDTPVNFAFNNDHALKFMFSKIFSNLIDSSSKML